jgi:hypothetical protein
MLNRSIRDHAAPQQLGGCSRISAFSALGLSLDGHVNNAPGPPLVLAICLPFAHRLRSWNLLSVGGQHFAMCLDRLARVVEGFLERIATGEAARHIEIGGKAAKV